MSLSRKKHVRHYCTIQSTPNITTKWFYFLESKTLINIRKLLGVFISFWSSRIIDQEPCQLYSARNTSDIHHLYHWSTKWSDCDIDESIKWGKWLRNGVLLPYQRPQSGGAVSFGTRVYFSVLWKLNSAIFADLINSAIRSWVASVNLNIACQCNL